MGGVLAGAAVAMLAILLVATLLLIPIFAWLKRRNWTRLMHYAAVSFIVGFLVFGSVKLYSLSRLTEIPDAEILFVVDNKALVDDGKLTKDAYLMAAKRSVYDSGFVVLFGIGWWWLTIRRSSAA